MSNEHYKVMINQENLRTLSLDCIHQEAGLHLKAAQRCLKEDQSMAAFSFVM